MFRFHVWGDRACFARPEFRRDRISYDIITPLAARGILESIYWSPAIRWHVDRIHVLQPIIFDWLGSEPCRQCDLIDVAYVIEAHFVLSDRATQTDHVAQHASLVRRRARRQEPYRQPFLGTGAYPAHFRSLEAGDDLPPSSFANESVYLGWTIHDLDTERPPQLRFFRPVIRRGIVELANLSATDLPA